MLKMRVLPFEMSLRLGKICPNFDKIRFKFVNVQDFSSVRVKADIS